jgi:hypothetical protein
MGVRLSRTNEKLKNHDDTKRTFKDLKKQLAKDRSSFVRYTLASVGGKGVQRLPTGLVSGSKEQVE